MSTTAIQMLDDPADGYRAGVCNIGPAEIRRRRRSGIAGLVAAGVLATVLVVIDAPSLLRLTVAAPLFVGLLGLVQAQLRFCVGFGAAGMRNFGALGAPARVEDGAARKTDLRRAASVTIAVALGATALAVGFALLGA